MFAKNIDIWQGLMDIELGFTGCTKSRQILRELERSRKTPRDLGNFKLAQQDPKEFRKVSKNLERSRKTPR